MWLFLNSLRFASSAVSRRLQDIPLFLTSLIPVESIDGYNAVHSSKGKALDIAAGFEVRYDPPSP